MADPARPTGQRRLVASRGPTGLVRRPEAECLGDLRSFVQRAAASARLRPCSRPHLVARWRQAGLPGRRREGPTAGPVRPDSDRWRSGPGQDARGDERTAVRPGWRSAGRAFTVVTGPNDTDCFRAGAG